MLISLLALTTACSDTVELDAPEVSGRQARACAALVDALPVQVADRTQREVEAGAGFGAAWGDPAIVLRCGVPRPTGFGSTAGCQTANGVDWYVPESQQTGRAEDITMTSVGRAAYVEVQLPKKYWPPATAMVDLGPALKRTIRSVRPCA